MDRADVAVHQLVGLVVRLAARAVGARVRAAVEITALLQAAPQLERGTPMLVRGRSDELVVRDVKSMPERLESVRDAVDVALRIGAVLGGNPFDIDAVFVGAGDEPNVAPLQALVAGDGIGGDSSICVANCGEIVGIVNRGGEVIRLHPSVPSMLNRRAKRATKNPLTAGSLVWCRR